MNNYDLLLTLTGGLAVALALGLFTQKIGLSPIVGYLLAGLVLGPYTPGFTANKHLAHQMAEIGVILLMFGVGLHFHFRELLAVKRIAIPGALVQSSAATLLSMVIMHYAFGWSWISGAVFGMAIAVASTVVLTRVLVDNKALHTPIGHIAIGWLVVEDLLTVFVLVLIPAIFGETGAQGNHLGWTLLLTTGKILVLVAFTFFVGGWAIPRLLLMIAKTRSRELFTLGILVIALGIALGAAKIFGVSMELGAFLAGMVVGRSEFSTRAANDALPLKDAFGVLFFVSVGMLFDWQTLLHSPLQIVATLAIVMIGKPLSAIFICLIRGYSLRTTLAVGAVLSQIGEFSFIVGTIAKQYHLIDEQAFHTIVATAILSITAAPFLFRLVQPTEAWIAKHSALWKLFHRTPHATETENHEILAIDAAHRAIIVGYGPIGRTLTRLLQTNEFATHIIESNIETIRELTGEKIANTFGDASHPEILRAAGIEHADIIIFSYSSDHQTAAMFREIKKLNPSIRIIARTDYLKQADELLTQGADDIFSGEGEVALSMTERVLERFGATREQIDRERLRIRNELFHTEEISPDSLLVK